MVESRMRARHMNATFDELLKLKLQLHFMVDFSEFSRFYDFVLFVCRENGQKNITVSWAVAAWRFVLAGRFRLLNQWCDFVEKNQRHNISEDTWQQVLAFTRFVHETLEGYDPEGIKFLEICLMDEHMYRISGSNKDTNLFCSYGDSRFRSYAYDDSLPDIQLVPELKRKLRECNNDKMESSEPLFSSSSNSNCTSKSKRRLILCRSDDRADNLPQDSCGESMEIVK
ncbi:hypothetical protein ERO13_A05G366750v2 [Gossypium hirsutum]|nr:hypothetical protein ERO13_A05G366750v2 [Gossypium hirsutum]